MSQSNKPSHLSPFESVATSVHSTAPKPCGSPSPFQLDAIALSRLGTDLPTIQALLGPEAVSATKEASPSQSMAREVNPIDRPTADGVLNHSPEWMAAIGRIGGLSRSPAKSQAARLNGAKGGRPRKAEPTDVISGDTKLGVVHIASGNPLSPVGDSRSDAN